MLKTTKTKTNKQRSLKNKTNMTGKERIELSIDLKKSDECHMGPKGAKFPAFQK